MDRRIEGWGEDAVNEIVEKENKVKKCSISLTYSTLILFFFRFCCETVSHEFKSFRLQYSLVAFQPSPARLCKEEGVYLSSLSVSLDGFMTGYIPNANCSN